MAAADVLAGLLGVALFAAAGLGIVQLLPGMTSLPRGQRLAYGYLLGIAWIGGSLYALSHVFAVPLRRPAVLAVLIAPILAGVVAWLRKRPGAPPRKGRPWTGLQKTAFAISALICLGVLCDTLANPLRDWDGRMTWVVQALQVHQEGTVDARALREPEWYITHPRYPLLLPLAQVAVFELFPLGEDAHAVYRPLYAVFLPVFLTLVYGGARRWVSGNAAALAMLSAALLPFLSFYPGGGAVSAYSDLPLACFYGGALFLLLRARPRLSHGIAAGLLLAAAVLAKNEGTPLALWALLLAGVALARRRKAVPVLAAALFAALALALLVSWRSGIPNRYDENYEELLTAANLWPEVVTRLPLLLPKIRFEMVAAKHWTVFWSVAPLLLLAGRRGLRRWPSGLLALAALAPLGVAWLAYAVSETPTDLVRMTWNRFLLQALLPFLWLLAFALDDLLRRSRWLPRALGGPARSPSPSPGRSAGTASAAAPSSAAPGLPTKSG